MDSLLERFHASASVCSNQNLVNGRVNHEYINPLHPIELNNTSLSLDLEGDNCDNNDCNNPMLKYISDALLEEDLEGKPCMLQNCLALQTAEKSFYDLLNPKHRPSFSQPPLSEYQSFENSDDDSTQSCHRSIGTPKTNPVCESLSETVLISHSLSQMESLGFLGVGEAIRNVVYEPENDSHSSTNGSNEKKNHQREDGNDPDKGRSNKQSAASAQDSVPQEMFEKVFFCQGENHESECCSPSEFLENEGSGKLWRNRQSERAKKHNNYNKEVVDVCTLLNQCAQAVASNDQCTVNELLKQIRQHSSLHGDATQRLAHYFADGLEARLAGTTTPSYSPVATMQTSAADVLRAYRLFVTASPLKKMSNFVANTTIMELAKDATRLHIIDFGISYGFQWPCLIQHISERPGEPPKIHITAIELPQPGFRPTERVEQTGRRLAKYAARFNVPFEYDVIAQKWESIRVEDLNIDRDELIVVNCMHRLRHIPDETVIASSPRDRVLKLIKKINPDLFVHGIINGTYDPPFFVTRFREALFHFGSLFDMFEAIVPREDQWRQMFEREIYGRDIMNVVACEGLERVERPETYKRWTVRILRAGFKQLPLDQDRLKKVKSMSKVTGYHKDFRIEEDREWMLQGWKGRIIMALSFWKPA
ncbi:hypothetical protein M0R45_017219 [Rubus argutus]|uniref:Scarecrow-like protein 30 n=1 Tax=Rubus argutus TaxID=59490 RepID=A0AAW1XV15_RUBAR